LDFGFASSGGWSVAEDEAIDRGKPLASVGGHDINNAAEAILLLEGDIEVYSPSLSSLSRMKT
jgi:hypothetical protein